MAVFFSQHRKYGYDVTLIAQFDRMIDKQLRGLIEYEYIHRKLSNYGFGGKIMSLIFGGNTFVVVQMWYPLKLKTAFFMTGSPLPQNVILRALLSLFWAWTVSPLRTVPGAGTDTGL